jgi:hypothetical protein
MMMMMIMMIMMIIIIIITPYVPVAIARTPNDR